MTPSPKPSHTGAVSFVTDDALNLALPIQQKVVLVMDLVESVRLMAANEAAVVQRWHGFVQHARAHVLPARHGRHVKSLGDGLLAEFDSAHEAVHAAQDLHHYFDAANSQLPPEQQMYLRAGLNAAQVYIDAIDIYGTGVNLAARVASLAGPGETIVTTEVRDHLTDGLDATLDDMGECYLKHVPEPVRVWRVGDAGPKPILSSRADQPAAAIPAIAVVPFEARGGEPEHLVVGELIADAVISLLGRSSHLRVISRLSTTAFRGRGAAPADIGSRLSADFVLSGSYVLVGSAGGGKLLVTAELAQAQSGQVVWTDRFSAEVGDLLQSESECAHHIALSCSMALLNSESEKARTQPVATLSAYSLQLGAINLMHRSRTADFEKGYELLLALAERHPRAPEVRAWLAKWHVLRVIRGISQTPTRDANAALDACHRALDLAPDSPLAMSVMGYTLCQVFGDKKQARGYLDRAIALAANEHHAWLYRSVWSSHYGTNLESVEEASRARLLSPLDPHAYFIETILANAYAANHQYAEAIKASERALRLDCTHAPTLRVLTLAQVESGHLPDARKTVKRLLDVVPGLTIDAYRAMGNESSAIRIRTLEALRSAGLPEHNP